nr:MAG: putative spike protein [Trout granulomatous virus]
MISGHTLCMLVLFYLYSYSNAQHELQLNPTTYHWLNCATSDCKSWQACPSTQATTCVSFSYTGLAWHKQDNTIIGYSNFTSQSLYDTISYTFAPSYVLSHAMTNLEPQKLCSLKSTIQSFHGFTPADCCLNPSASPACSYFSTGDTSFITGTPYQCTASYYGYGSPYGTDCEPYFASVSPYGTSVTPSGDVFTNFGEKSVHTYDCFYENWARYRPAPYTNNPSDPRWNLCHSIYYYVWTLSDTNHQFTTVESEPGDKVIMKQLSSHTPVYLTLGGWTSNNTVLYQAISSRRLDTIAMLRDLHDNYGVTGVCIDFEFIGGSNQYSNIFLLDWVPDLLSFLSSVRLEFGPSYYITFVGLAVGSHFLPTIYQQIDPLIDAWLISGYDLHGDWEVKATQQAALVDDPKSDFPTYSLFTSVDNMLAITTPDKIILGLPQYTRGVYTSLTGSTTGPYPPTTPMCPTPPACGTDIVISTSHGEIPSTHDTTKGDIIIEDPSQPKFYISKGSRNGRTFNHFFMNSTTASHIRSTLQPKGITRWYSYASSMNLQTNTNFKTALLSQSRKARQLSTYYKYPAPAGSGVTSCPGIVVFTDTFVVTTTAYAGSHALPLLDGNFYSPRSTFTCSPGFSTLMPTTTTRCSGIDPSNLLPSDSSSVSIVCPDMTFFGAKIAICASSTTTSKPTHLQLEVSTSIEGQFQFNSLPIYSQHKVSTTSFSVPYKCINFTPIPSCISSVCGSSHSCVTKLQESPASYACQSAAAIAIVYNNTLDLVKRSQTTTELLFNQVVLESSKFGVVTHTRQTRGLFGILSITSLIMSGVALATSSSALYVSIKNQAELSSLRNDVNSKFTTIDQNFDQITSKFNHLSTTTSDAFIAQSNINTQLQSSINQLQENLEVLSNFVTTQLSSVSSSITQLSEAIDALSDQVNYLAYLTSGISSYTSRLTSVTVQATNTAVKFSTLQSHLSNCLTSLQQQSFTGCIHKSGNIIPLKVVYTPFGNTRYLSFIYAEAELLGYQQYKSALSYCDQNFLYSSSPGCFFLLNGSSIDHRSSLSAACPTPATVVSMSCQNVTLDLSSQSIVRPYVFPLLNLTLPTPVKTNISFTPGKAPVFQNITQIDQTLLLDLAQQLQAIQLQLNPVGPISTSSFSPVVIALTVISAVVFLAVTSIVIYMLCKTAPFKPSRKTA